MVCGCPNVSYFCFDADEFADAGLQIISKCRMPVSNLKIISDCDWKWANMVRKATACGWLCDSKWASVVRKATAFYGLCVKITLQNQVFDFVAPQWNIRGIFV